MRISVTRGEKHRGPALPATETTGEDAAQRRPRLAMVVANRVLGDSRVLRMATTAEAAGYDVTILGLAHRTVRRFEVIGGVPVYRVLPRYDAHGVRSRAVKAARRKEARGRREAARAALRRSRRRALRADQARTQASGAGDGPPALARGRLLLHRVAGRAHSSLTATWETTAARVRDRGELALDRSRAGLRRDHDWRRIFPIYVDYEDAFVDTLLQLRPDLIHVHDVQPLPAGDAAAGLLAGDGHPVGWVYDAHEDVTGQELPDLRQRLANEGCEARFAPRASAVLTVSAQLATRLQDRLRLPRPPVVVANAPSAERMADPSGERQTVREELGLADDVPLLVYSGALAARRGVMTAVDALGQLPGVHLVVVGYAGAAHGDELVAHAAARGARDRIHLRPYVAAESVTWYLSTATAGVAPFLATPSHGVALATKIREYLHAGLPLLVSDVGVMAEFVRSTGTGTVFPPGDVDGLASAARALLDHLDEHRAAITPELLAEHSWEGQEDRLLALWREVLPSSVPPPRPRDGRSTQRAAPRSAVVGLGPAGHAGQSWAWANALRRARPDVGTEVFTLPREGTALEFPRDRTRELAVRTSIGAALREYRHLTDTCTHVLAESLTPLFGNLLEQDAVAELRHLVARGIPAAVVLHGSEIRDPRKHSDREPLSPFPQLDPEFVARLDRQSRRNRERLADLELPVLVSTPDLLEEVDGATWLPVCVDLETWVAPPPFQRERPVVAHLPSSALKGADEVGQQLQALHDRGVIEYSRHENLSPQDMPAMVAAADIVLDQFALGIYGVMACEAMAAGRVVVSHVADHVRSLTPLTLPIVEAVPSDVGRVVEELVADREKARLVGDEGAAYVRELHDGRRSAAVLCEALGLT